MKIRTFLLVAILLFSAGTTQAQFFKKLVKSAEKAAEKAVIRKTEQKTQEKTNKALDKVFDVDFSKQQQVDPATTKKTYSYGWKYAMQIQHIKGNMNMTYYLNEGNATSFASVVDMQGRAQMTENMILVMDREADVTLMLFEQNGQKIGQALPAMMNNISDAQEVDYQDEVDEFEFKKIGTKVILGYTCQGFEIENDEVTATVYVAPNAPINFNQVVQGENNKQLPKNFNPKWIEKMGENSLMMEMDLVHKKKPKQNSKMVCVALEKERKNIDLSQYEFQQMINIQE